MTKRLKKAAIIASIAVGVLLVVALVIGILNALVADGKWTFGWNDYRYDETDYTIEGGSIPAEGLKKIELDWIDGEVQIVSCQDSYVSLTETAEDELPKSAMLRWRVSEDGSTLTVKYRKSSWFFGIGSGNRQKKLILRIPERFFAQLEELDIDVTVADVTVEGITAKRLSFSSGNGALTTASCIFESADIETKNGAITLGADISSDVEMESTNGKLELHSRICPTKVDLETESGELTLRLPKDAEFALTWESESGHVTGDFAYEKNGTIYKVGNGTAAITAKSKRSGILLTFAE